MATRHVIRLAAWLGVAVGAPVLAAPAGALGLTVAVSAVGVVGLWVTLWLPRRAHPAFEAGRFARAARRYWLLEHPTRAAPRGRGAVLSRGCCRGADPRLRHAGGLPAPH